MGKTLLICVLFFDIASTTLETEVKRETASKLLCNLFVDFSVESINFCQLLFNLFIMFSGLAIISTMFIFIDFIYVSMNKVSKSLALKLHDLCNIYRSVSCTIFSILVTNLGI